MAILGGRTALKNDFDMRSAKSCVFYHSQWELCKEEEHVSTPYIVYRVIFMIILVSSLSFSIACQSYLFHIFLTNWSFMIQTLYGILFCVNILWAKRKILTRKSQHIFPELNKNGYELKDSRGWGNAADEDASGKNGDVIDDATFVNIENNITHEQLSSTTVLTPDLPLKKSDTVIRCNNNNNNNKVDSPSTLEKVIWMLLNITHVLPHIVVLGYWLFVYEYDPMQPPCEKFKSHYILHGAASALALIDTLIVAVPVRKTHFVFPSFTILLFVVFSYLYEISGGPYRPGKEFIYSILNWRYKPLRAFILVFVGVLISPIAHFSTCWGFHLIRLKLVSLYHQNKK